MTTELEPVEQDGERFEVTALVDGEMLVLATHDMPSDIVSLNWSFIYAAANRSEGQGKAFARMLCEARDVDREDLAE